LMGDIDNEYIEDIFDLLIVAGLTDDETEKPKQVYIDQVSIF